MSSGFLQEVKDITLYSHGSGHISMIGFHGIGILFHGICISFLGRTTNTTSYMNTLYFHSNTHNDISKG